MNFAPTLTSEARVALLTLLLPNLANGGAERVALTLAEEFLSRGHEVDVVTVLGKGELIDRLPAGARLFELQSPRIRSALLPLVRYLRERRPTSLMASMWPLTIIAILAARLGQTKSRVIVSDHSILSKQYGGSWFAMAMLRLTTRLVYPLAEARVCVSKAAASDMAKISAIPPKQFATIYNPIARRPVPVATEPAVEALWASAERRILTVGMLKGAKNHELLIRAFALLDQNQSIKLMILGEGELRPFLERLIKELGIAGRVILPGFASDPWPYYASADLFVLSSDREGLGNVMIEAMIAGLPVVSTDCEGPREILDGGRLGRLVPIGDAEALAEAMATALGDQHDPEPGREQVFRLTANSCDQYLELMLGDAAMNSGGS